MCLFSFGKLFCDSCEQLDITHPSVHMAQRFCDSRLSYLNVMYLSIICELPVSLIMWYMLSTSQDIDRNQKVCAMNGQQFYLVDIIAHILHHLKCQLLTEVRDFGYNIKTSDIDWVITVPAIWKSRGREIIREAGYMVSPNSSCKHAITRAGLTCRAVV